MHIMLLARKLDGIVASWCAAIPERDQRLSCLVLYLYFLEIHAYRSFM